MLAIRRCADHSYRIIFFLSLKFSLFLAKKRTTTTKTEEKQETFSPLNQEI